jgi:hypothetical protein
MDREINQYVWLATPDGAYQEDVIPVHSDIHRKDILYWDLIPLWNLRNQYTPQQRIFNSEADEFLADYRSPRQQRMVSYLQSQEPERIAFAIVPVEVRYPNRIVGIALLLWSKQ